MQICVNLCLSVVAKTLCSTKYQKKTMFAYRNIIKFVLNNEESYIILIMIICVKK